MKRDDSGQRSPGYISDALRSPWATFAKGGIGLNNLPVTNVFWTNCFYIGTTWPTQADTLNAKHWKLYIWPKLQFYSKGHTEKPKLNLLKNHIRCKLHRIVQCSNVAIILLSFGYQKVPVHDFMCVCVRGVTYWFATFSTNCLRIYYQQLNFPVVGQKVILLVNNCRLVKTIFLRKRFLWYCLVVLFFYVISGCWQMI